MPEFRHSSRIEVPAEELFAWHARPGAFERLKPPWQRIEIVRRQGGIEDGAELEVLIGRRPLRIRWLARHRDYEAGRAFCDEQIRGPFARWRHTHRFIPEGASASVLEDHIDYALPYGPMGPMFGGYAIARSLGRMFRFRHARTRNDLLRHHAFRGREPMRIAISGASGLVGSGLAAFLTAGGHRVDRLVRRTPQPGSTEIRWNPATSEIDSAALEGVDGVVHLAGESVAAGRWNSARKDAIRNSRVDGTRLLCRTLAALKKPPRVLVAASALGYYGDRGDETVTEESSAGVGFLPDVCQAWEAATGPAAEAGIRVVNLRIGVVMSPAGGALQKMLTPFRLGLGGRVGSGRQIMSWIALDDLVGVIHHALFTEGLSGPVNAVAPHPVANAEFAKTLGRVLRRPTVFPLPASVVRAIFGEMGQSLLLEGARVQPQKLQQDGFQFLYPDLEAALRGELFLPAS